MKINKLIKPINEGYVVKSKKKSLSERYYTCPECHNRTLGEVSENDDLYICDECGASGRGYETFEGNIAFYDDVDECKSINETYWIDNKEVMDEVDRLVKELQADGWMFRDDRYTGSKYYVIFQRRGDNGAEFCAIKYSHTHTPEVVELSYKQIVGDVPMDSFDGMRRKLGKILLPQNESKSIKEESKSWGGHKHPEQDKIEKALMAINGTTKVEFDYRPNDGVYKVPENHLIILPFCRDDKVFGDGSEYFKNRKKWKDSVLAKLRQLGWTQEDPVEDNDTYLYLVMKRGPKMNEDSSLYQKNKNGSIYKMTPEVTKVLQEIARLYKFFDYKKDVAKVKFRSDVIRQLQIFCKWYLEEANSAKPDTRELKNFAIQIANIVRTRNVVNESKSIKTLGAGAKKLNETTYSMEDNMGDWKQICRAYCRKIGAELLFVNETSFGYEDKNGQMVHMYVDELMDALGLSESLTESKDYKVKFFQVFEVPKSPKESGKMIGQRGTLDDANAFGVEKAGEGNYIIKAVCDDGQTRPIDNDTKPDAFKMVNEDTVVPSSYEFDDDVDDLTYYYDDELFKDNLENSPYTEIASKQVMDSDGFMTDYTMYMNINTGEYVFVFGDKDVYSPDDGYFDWECETEAEARAWFDNYTGFSDDLDDMDESLDLTKDEIELLLMGQDMGSWYDEILDNEETLNRYYDAENKAKKIATAKNMDFADYLDTLQINEEVSGNSDDDNSYQTKPSPAKSTDNNQEESPIVAKKSDGSYLIPASNGDGYVAFNRSDVCMGNISASNENEAKGKFNANKFDESLDEKLDGSGWWSVEWDLTLDGEEIGFDDLSESTQEHIADSILDGYLQGEIAEWDDDEETENYGWWVARFDISVEDNDRVRFEDLSETSQEQISNAIKDGYVSGEIFE